MATIDDFLQGLSSEQQALARAGGARIASMDALAREQFVQQAIIGQDPAMRACAVFGLALAEAELAARPPPAPVELTDEEKKLFQQIDDHFHPPAPKKEAAP